MSYRGHCLQILSNTKSFNLAVLSQATFDALERFIYLYILTFIEINLEVFEIIANIYIYYAITSYF